MKTKQKLLSLALALLLILALAACGATSSVSRPETTAYKPSADTQQSSVNAGAASGSDIGTGSGSASASESGEATVEQFSSEKIIYSGDARIETLEFDKSIETLQAMLSDCGGYVQSSRVDGVNYAAIYGGKSTKRSAEYTLRIPADKFKSVQDGLGSLGNVVSLSTGAENITMQYSDTQSHLDALRTKESRLLDLLSKAGTMEDIITLENSLSDVRYEIESLTSQLKNWDSQVSYSTLSLTISEVAIYSEDNSSSIGYGQQLKAAFLRSLRAVGSFFKSLFKFLVGALPVLMVLVVIAVPVYLIVRAKRGKKKAESLPEPDGEDTEPKT